VTATRDRSGQDVDVDAPGPAGLLPVATAAQVRRYTRAAMTGRWRWLTATTAVMIVESAIALLPPLAIGWITQDIVEHRATSAIVWPVVLLAAGALAGAITAWGSSVLLAHTVLPEVAQLREDVLTTALALPVDAVEEGGIGDLVSRVSGDVERVSDAAEGALGSFLAAGLTILVTLVGLASLDWRFALAGLLAVPIQAHTLRWYLRVSRPIYADGRVAEGRRTSALLSVFAALPTVRAYRLGDRNRDAVEQASEEAMDYEFRATRAATRFYGRLNGAEFVGLGAILLVGYLLVRHHAVSIGEATTAALFFAALFNPINTVLGVFDSIQQAIAALARLVGVTTSHPDRGAVTQLPDGRPELQAHDIDFGYGDGPDVLHRVSADLRPGEHVAVVGTTGSGKSTLASLLAGIRHPRHGAVTLAGVPVADIDPTTLHRTVALVTQETHVFAGAVADNLRLARPDAGEDELGAVLDVVGAAGWVDLLPAGIHTRVGAGEQQLTASQAQHLALARLLLLDPAIVILDEATAEAGSDAARTLDAAAAAVLAGRTGLVIAHRLTQAAAADTVLVMDGGVISERGSHADLVRRGGGYADLWRSWTTPPLS